MNIIKVTTTKFGIVKDACGNPVGQVEKTNIATSITSALMDRPGPARWIPRDVDGYAVAREQTTRKAAVAIVARYATPSSVEDVRKHEAWYGNATFVSAYVRVRGCGISVSRYDTETEWIVDSYTPLGGFMPTFSNGMGARVTAAHSLTGPAEVIETLNNAYAKIYSTES